MDYYGRKLLLSSSNNSTSNASPTSSKAMNSETDFVVVVAALVCAIICVLGLIVVARCAWLRRGVDTWSFGIGGGNQLGNKGVKKKVLNSLPKYTHNHNTGEVGVEECGICLTEYGDGDEVRVLPQCGHKFHVKCIDTWLKSHASCPSCRQTLVLARCHKCGELSTAKCKLGPVSSAPSTSSIPVLP